MLQFKWKLINEWNRPVRAWKCWKPNNSQKHIYANKSIVSMCCKFSLILITFKNRVNRWITRIHFHTFSYSNFDTFGVCIHKRSEGVVKHLKSMLISIWKIFSLISTLPIVFVNKLFVYIHYYFSST